MPDNSNIDLSVDESSAVAMSILKDAQTSGRPVILLAGAGISVDSGFPLASELKEYLVHVREHVTREGFSNVRQYIEEARWPSRHDLRIDLMRRFQKRNRSVSEKRKEWSDFMMEAERNATQSSLIAELRRNAPTMAASLEEVFSLNKSGLRPEKRAELEMLYGKDNFLGTILGRRSPKNIAYRSLLFHLCDNNQATIDACFDHFMRDRSPTTTHQFIYFLTRVLRTPVILTTNFDPFLEQAFASEGLTPRVYEVQGEGTIPSSRLLLSQPLSIVKLHGGTHQMQTGFNLDDPLSPAALASFSELYKRLGDTFDQPPLTLVIGYSGSDRRVMDIISAQIDSWRPLTKFESDGAENALLRIAGRPNVLWVSRDPWWPDLLRSPVQTHPNILERDGSEKRVHSQFPAHVVRYRDGRLFLLEALQTLLRHFPIARSHYQAVNFVPHSVGGRNRDDNPKRVAERLRTEWRLALIFSTSGGGSSSTLVEVAQNLESDGYRTIWIDLTEVVGVAALIDLVSERMSKLDGRLQPIRRPPMLRSLLENQDEMNETHFASASEAHEFDCSVQWLRLALRRGKYLLAIDSLDEFPCEHPALDDPNKPRTGVAEKLTARDAQRALVCRLIRELAELPDLLGESRIAIALSLPEHDVSAFSRLIKDMSIREQDPLGLVRVEKIAREKLPGLEFIERFCRLGEKAEAKKEKPAARPEERLIWTVTIILSCCARRVRSEVLLRRCVGEYLARLGVNGWSDLDGLGSFVQPREGGKDGEIIPVVFAGHLGPNGPFTGLWTESAEDWQHRNDKANPSLDEDIIRCIHWLADHGAADQKPHDTPCVREHDSAPKLLWLYRTEGGYHWMHRDVRNGLYSKLKDSGQFGPLAMAHHVIALFCYDELYERSRDPRAFSEYLFHRIAAIRLASSDGKNKCALDWITRLLIALHREKHALLSRVRLPGFIYQLMQLRETIQQLNDHPELPENNPERARSLLRDLMQLLADFFLASGHPHFALAETLARLRLEDIAPPGRAKPGVSRGAQKSLLPSKLVTKETFARVKKIANRAETERTTSPEKHPSADRKVWFSKHIHLYTALRDIAYSCHDPLLSPIPFPWFPRRDQVVGADRKRVAAPEAQSERPRDWVDLMAEFKKEQNLAVRKHRLNLALHVYRTLGRVGSSRPRAKHPEEWSEHDQEMDFFGGMVRKTLEFQLLQEHSASWITSSQVYLFKNVAALEALGRFASESAALPRAELRTELGDELNGENPLLRRSGRRQRHECYRLCLRSRIAAANYLNATVTADGKRVLRNADSTILSECTKVGEVSWDKIRRWLTDAESILNRHGGPADRQAMAITRLTAAELFVRRAEELRLHHDELDRKTAVEKVPLENSDAIRTLKKLKLACEKSLSDARATLSTVEQLMNEGRGENRWRFFYLLTLARTRLLSAYIYRTDTLRTSHNDMTWAARHLAGALTNCGIWTDRYDVLRWWWSTWKEVAYLLHFSPDELQKGQDRLGVEKQTEYEIYCADLYARLGISWRGEGHENPTNPRERKIASTA